MVLYTHVIYTDVYSPGVHISDAGEKGATMALKHTLLGLLILYPRTGYDLYKRMERARFLLESASLRRIYPTLKRLAEGRLVVYEIEPQEGKPDRKIYSVTDKGEAEFLEWLRESPDQDAYLEPILSRAFFWGMLDKETLLAQLGEMLNAWQEKRDRLQAWNLAPPHGPCRPFVDPERVTDMWEQMLKYGRAEVETQIRWLGDTIQHIEREW